jgi:hypothetical protein
VVCHRLVDHRTVHRPTLRLVAGEQLRSTPSLQRGCDLPAQIHGIAHTHVHAIATEGRMQVTRVTGQEQAPIRVAVGQQLAGHPGISAQYLVGQIDAGAISDHRGRLGFRQCAIWPDGRHEEPGVVAIHWTERAESILADLPINGRRAEAMRRRQPWRPKDDVVGTREPIGTLHAGTDQLAH